MKQVRETDFITAEDDILRAELAAFCGEVALVLGEKNTDKIIASRAFRKFAVLDHLEPCARHDAVAEDCIIADYAALPFAKDSVDFMLLSHVSATVENYTLLLQEASHVLREDGVLALTLLNPSRPLSKTIQLKCWPTQVKILSIFKVIDALREAGFDELKLDYYAMGFRTNWLNQFLKRFFPGLSLGYLIIAKRNITKFAPLSEQLEFKPSLAINPALEVRSKI